MKNNNTYKKNLYVIIYLFLLLFIAMLGYFSYYIYFQSPEDVNSSYNSRQENLSKKVVRGSILANDGSVLAETIVNSDGSETRNYPYGELFSHVVGFSTKGRSGLESSANISLLTSNAYLGEKINNEINEQKNQGDNIITTLDPSLQEEAYRALGIYKGAVIAIEPSSGKILAMVSKPDFNPNKIVSQWEELNADTANSPLLNRASLGLYPPGSVFKIVTLLDYYREKGITGSYSYDCNGSFSYADVTIKCYHGSRHGNVDLKKSFAKSCNSSFANIGTYLRPESFRQTAEDLLFNKALPGKIKYRESSFSYNKDSDVEEMLHTAIGQGKTLVTPLHIALITSAIANDGVLKKPYLIERVENCNKTLVKQYEPADYKRLMSSEEAAFLSEYMEAVVLEGTGSKLSGLSYEVAGKTGSAEYSDEKGESHAWFTGFSKTGDNPDLVVTVIVEGAGSGSDYAVPIAKRLFENYHNRNE